MSQIIQIIGKRATGKTVLANLIKRAHEFANPGRKIVVVDDLPNDGTPLFWEMRAMQQADIVIFTGYEFLTQGQLRKLKLEDTTSLRILLHGHNPALKRKRK